MKNNRKKLTSLLLVALMLVGMVSGLGAHSQTHSFEYTASGATVTATCTDTECGESYSLTLVPPTDLTCDGAPKPATVEGLPLPDDVYQLSYDVTPVSYFTSGGEPLDGAPAAPGDYVAQMTWGGANAVLSYSLVAPETKGGAKGGALRGTPTGNVAKVGETEFETLDAAISAWAGGTTLTLLKDVETSSTITVSGTKTLDLNGFGIKMTGSGSVITINSGAALNLDDSNTETSHKFTVPADGAAGLAVLDETSGTYTITGGYITGGNTASGSTGGGVTVSDGTFVMNGGTIIGNQNTVGGSGGVYVTHPSGSSTPSFTLNGGAICHNTGANGGGVCVANGSFTMSGGTISGNASSGGSGGNGGGVMFGSGTAFILNGGMITGNTAAYNGGGVYYNSTSFSMSGGVIRDNTAQNGTANNLYLNNYSSNPYGIIAVASEGLASGTSVGVSIGPKTPGTFTSGIPDATTAETYKACFSSDNSTYEVHIVESGDDAGQLELYIPPAARILDGEGATVTSGTFADMLSAWADGRTLQLLKNVETGSTISVGNGTDTVSKTLDLNGYGIKANGGSFSVITVPAAATLTINDSSPNTPHKFTVKDAASNGAGLATVDDTLTSGYQTFTGGYITGGKGSGTNPYGGGLYINEGTVEMYGGTIIGNGIYGQTHGGGFRTMGNSARVIMHDVTIRNNAGLCGGACRLSYGNVALYDVKILNNIVANDGGGIHDAGYVPLVLEDCEISGNYVANNGGPGGGIWMAGAQMTISGTTVVENNYSNTTLSNLEIRNSSHIINVGALSEGTSIGVRMTPLGTFTSGWSTSMSGNAKPEDYFTSDQGYTVMKDGNELALADIAATVTVGETTTYCNVFFDNDSSTNDAVSVWNSAASGAVLKLCKDVTTDRTVAVSGTKTLDLNGCGIRMTGTGSVISVPSGADLTLTDSDQTTEHMFTVPADNAAGLATLDETNGTCTVTGGYITGGNAAGGSGGGVGVDGGTFTMNGGTVIGNTATYGGGVYVYNNGTFTMNVGTVTCNTAQGSGGGVGAVGGTFIMVDGTISRNMLTSYSGGGVHVQGNGAFRMENGTITGNTAQGNGGGVYIHSNGTVTMTGGTVTANTANGSGNGIYVDNELLLSGEVHITGNTKSGADSNVYLTAGKAISLTGALSDGASIGMTMAAPGVFTNSETTDYNDATKFTSDAANYQVFKNNNGQLQLIPTDTVASVLSGSTETFHASLGSAVSAWNAADDAATLTLRKDVETTSTVTVSGAKTLDLNGFGIKAASAGFSVVTVLSDADLTITDSAPETTGGDNRPSGVTAGGYITGGSVGQNSGGGVTVNGGTLRLTGGAISGNANTYGSIGNCGGGVYVCNGGALYMTGGEISGNTSYVGGGVGADTSATTVSVTGGAIKNNTTQRFGSAIFAGRSSDAVFSIGGDASIIDNISKWAKESGGDKDGEGTLNSVVSIRLSGDPVIHGDWKTNGTSSPNTHLNLDNDGSGIQCVELEDELTNETGTPKITMTPLYRWTDLENGQTFVFTTNWGAIMGSADPAQYFKVDASKADAVKVVLYVSDNAYQGAFVDTSKYYVNFDANGGTGELMSTQSVTKNSSLTLNANSYTNGDRAFIEWNTKADGSGTAYADKASVTPAGDLTLYAQWTQLPKAKTPELTVTQPTAAGGEGTVNTTTAHEYSADNGETWTDCEENQSFPAGSYLIRAKATDTTLASEPQSIMITTFIDGGGEVEFIVDGNTVKSELSIGESTPKVTVANLDLEARSLSEGTSQPVTVTMTVESKTEADVPEAEAEALKEKAPAETTLEFLSITIQKKVGSGDTETMTATTNVLEIIVPYKFSGKTDIAVYRYHDGAAQKLKETTDDPGADGTYRLDKEIGLIYIYASEFSTYAIGYTQCYKVSGTVRYGSYSGKVSVTLQMGDFKETYSGTMSNGTLVYSFNSIPQGTYDLVVTWTENDHNVMLAKPVNVNSGKIF